MVCIFMGQGSPVSLLLFVSMETIFPLSHISASDSLTSYMLLYFDDVGDVR
jgi:hypothetical protein